MKFGQITSTNFRKSNQDQGKKNIQQFGYSASIQNLIQKKYNLPSFRSFYSSHDPANRKKKQAQLLSFRETHHPKGKNEQKTFYVPLQFFPPTKNRRFHHFHQLQYQQEPSCPSVNIRQRYSKSYSSKDQGKKGKSQQQIKKNVHNISSNSVRTSEGKKAKPVIVEEDEKIMKGQVEELNINSVEEKDKLITYYKEKYGNQAIIKNRKENEKKKRISLLLEKVSDNKPQINYRSYEPLRQKKKIIYEEKQQKQKEEDFSLLDPW